MKKQIEKNITEKRLLKYLESQGFILSPDQFFDAPPYPTFMENHSTQFSIHLTAKITAHITMIFGMWRDSYLADGCYGYTSIQYTDTRKHERDWYTHLFEHSNDYKKLLDLNLKTIVKELRIEGGL